MVVQTVRLNGEEFKVTLKELKIEMLTMISDHAPLATLEHLKKSMRSYSDIIEEYCKRAPKETKGTDLASLSRELKAAVDTRKKWESFEDRDTFLEKFYQQLLSLEGMPIGVSLHA